MDKNLNTSIVKNPSFYAQKPAQFWLSARTFSTGAPGLAPTGPQFSLCSYSSCTIYHSDRQIIVKFTHQYKNEFRQCLFDVQSPQHICEDKWELVRHQWRTEKRMPNEIYSSCTLHYCEFSLFIAVSTTKSFIATS